MISNPQPQLLIDLVRQRPAWNIIPLEGSLPAVLPDHDTWVFVEWNAGRMTGLDLCKALRTQDKAGRLHFNMVLHFDEIQDHAASLKSLAIDLFRAPLDSRRLIERVESDPIADRLEPVRFSVGDLFVDTRAFLVKMGDQPAALTPTEYQILVYLLKNANRVIARSELILAIGKSGRDVRERAIDVWISRLRRTLAALGGHVPIRNVKGKGYVLDT